MKRKFVIWSASLFVITLLNNFSQIRCLKVFLGQLIANYPIRMKNMRIIILFAKEWSSCI